MMLLASALILVARNDKHYDRCKLPILMWIVVDHTVYIVFRLLMLVDNSIVSTIGLDHGGQLRGKRLFGRVVVACVTYALLYPFLWVSTVVGAIWIATEWDCLPGNQIWSIVQSLLFTFSGLVYFACIFGRKWLKRWRVHLRHVSPGTRVSEFKVLLSMICHPNDVAYEDVIQDMILNQRIQMVESMLELLKKLDDVMIRRLPIYLLREIPTDCSDCSICLKEFRINQKVRGLPCAHIFHKKCIATWLRVDMSCPRCRCVPGGAEQSDDPASQPFSASYVGRMQRFLVPAHTDAPPSESTPRTENNIR
ncbi:E3 ubiquitin-protein ligase SIS3-like [Rutidosis leptorrhynchoides]|uniref:E3 ubiquitin-protein ligase SIS3-like n=1 Tax=Rutidosis leptorrhynchoides TaxID=125765 RepID=UPI003A99189E